jgi:hypothetical protein
MPGESPAGHISGSGGMIHVLSEDTGGSGANELAGQIRSDRLPIAGQAQFIHPRSFPVLPDASDVTVFTTGFQPGFLLAVSTASTP